MDPDAALEDLLNAIAVFREHPPDSLEWRTAAQTIADRAEALHHWISHGSHLPAAWRLAPR